MSDRADELLRRSLRITDEGDEGMQLVIVLPNGDSAWMGCYEPDSIAANVLLSLRAYLNEKPRAPFKECLGCSSPHRCEALQYCPIKDVGVALRERGTGAEGAAGGSPQGLNDGQRDRAVLLDGRQSDPASPPHAAAEPEKPMNEATPVAQIPSTKTLPEQLRGFAAYCESVGRGEGFDKDDCTMFARKFREAADALETIGQPIGTLWQHGETGRKQVEFADEPRTVAHAKGWLPVGLIYLASPSAQPIARDEQDAKRYRKLCDLAWGKPIQDGIYDLQFPSFNYGDPDKHPKAAADCALDALLAHALKSAGKE